MVRRGKNTHTLISGAWRIRAASQHCHSSPQQVPERQHRERVVLLHRIRRALDLLLPLERVQHVLQLLLRGHNAQVQELSLDVPPDPPRQLLPVRLLSLQARVPHEVLAHLQQREVFGQEEVLGGQQCARLWRTVVWAGRGGPAFRRRSRMTWLVGLLADTPLPDGVCGGPDTAAPPTGDGARCGAAAGAGTVHPSSHAEKSRRR
eukprot:CAMPEP_0174336780 /NCGR_PEP_ID=MMETSP0810-20121108/21799_1 /TAXON_ID=73025 ORGANISM="Eutreptiella gymnastica-like, Strain CCMP1594" /NCGR_SAMPLE_ID=MMETSP0810 /ASSEMBLY_ACC=CAM_ASM_000659 /LENGTH=204 /DNA_ID=CAMNT_0015455849 /DNA_START=220 /DNA_END=830 /DNA_ORIENTATION=+